MPIRPENRDRYPDDWPELSAYIRFDRAEGRCECDGRCGDAQCHGLAHGRCNAEHGKPHPVNGKRTVLTCAHLNHRPEERGEDELAAFCARCHLYYDREHHASSRREAAEARRAAERARVLSTSAVMAFTMECATGRRIAR
jgi:hypothetical protein